MNGVMDVRGGARSSAGSEASGMQYGPTGAGSSRRLSTHPSVIKIDFVSQSPVYSSKGQSGMQVFAG
jgi:hypothetical protein